MNTKIQKDILIFFLDKTRHIKDQIDKRREKLYYNNGLSVNIKKENNLL